MNDLAKSIKEARKNGANWHQPAMEVDRPRMVYGSIRDEEEDAADARMMEEAEEDSD